MRGLSRLANHFLRVPLAQAAESVLTRQSALTPAAACKTAPSVSPMILESRCFSALPELLPNKHETETAPELQYADHNLHSESGQSEAANHRRLSEMRRAASRQKPSRRTIQLPSSQETSERLQSHKNASCSGPSPQEGPALHWREVVEGLRQQNAQRDQTGAQMLTDTFGCDQLSPLKLAFAATLAKADTPLAHGRN